MAKPKGQPDRRRDQMFTDQHGRSWYAVIELATGDPCGPLDARFDAPLKVPQKYIKTTKEHGKLHINYDGWIADIRRANEDYDKQFRAHAIRMFGDKAADAIDNPPPALLDAAGPRPNAWQPVDAAKKGNKWVLGLVPSSAKPPWAKEFFPDVVAPKTAYPDLEYEDVSPAIHESWEPSKKKAKKQAA
jgi:hypothetical protein